jgi:hypothetical protein
MTILASTFGCQIDSFPFTYLGLPMGTSKPKVDDFIPLVQRIEKRLTSTSNFLTQAGRLDMVNSVLSTLPTFYMAKIKLPLTMIEQIDKYRKHYFWNGSDLNNKKPPLVAWSVATRPKAEGGLDILNLKSQNDTLLLKNLHKFFNKANCPWVDLIWNNHYSDGKLPGLRPCGSFWRRAVLKQLDNFKGISMTHIQNGSTILFWQDKDLWADKVRCHLSAELFSFTTREQITLQQVRSLDNL